MERRNCSFCGNSIEPGTGRMYIRTDGSVFYFDRHKCFSNFISLKRIPRETRWSSLSRVSARWKGREKKQRPKVQRRYMPAVTERPEKMSEKEEEVRETQAEEAEAHEVEREGAKE